MKKTILGISYEEFRRQCTANVLTRDSNSPIRKFNTVEPCIRGGEKIIADKSVATLLRRIYSGSEDCE